MSACVKVCGCRPHDGVAARRGSASANLQGRKPREVGEGGASEAMGISGVAGWCGGAVNACVGSDQGVDETGRPIAIGRTGVAQRRSNDTTAIEVSARVSIVV